VSDIGSATDRAGLRLGTPQGPGRGPQLTGAPVQRAAPPGSPSRPTGRTMERCRAASPWSRNVPASSTMAVT